MSIDAIAIYALAGVLWGAYAALRQLQFFGAVPARVLAAYVLGVVLWPIGMVAAIVRVAGALRRREG